MNKIKGLSKRAAVFVLIFFCAMRVNAQRQPNILLITADDMGMQMGALNTPGVSTPTLDSLVSNGTFFLDAYATFPSCSPSRSSIMTSNFPHVHGVTTNVFELLDKLSAPGRKNDLPDLNKQFAIRDSIATLVSVLGSAGYFTGLTGKFHVPSPEKFPFNYWGKAVDAEQFFTKAKKANKPFFLNYNFHSPHRPYAKSAKSRSGPDLNELDIPAFLPVNKTMQQDWSDYLGAVEATDASVNELFHQLKKEGLADNTIVIFISDHGPSIHRGKYYPYPFGSAVPVIFSGPGIQKSARTKQLVSLLDIMPTVSDLLNIAAPVSVQGASLLPLLKGSHKPVNSYVCSEVSFPRNGETNYQARAMSDGRFWYVRSNGKARMDGKPEDNYEQAIWKNFSYTATIEGQTAFPQQYKLMMSSEGTPPEEELYDLHSDPWTIYNILPEAVYKNVLSNLRKQMNDWIVATNDAQMIKTIK